MIKSWPLRHRIVTSFLVALIFILILVGKENNRIKGDILITVLCSAIFSILSISSKANSLLRQNMAVLGLLTTSTGIIYLSGGRVIAHFSIILSMLLVAFYEDVYSYIIALLYLSYYYFCFAIFNPLVVFNPLDASKDSALWSIAIILLSILTSAPLVTLSYLSQRNAKTESALQALITTAALRERKAVEIHDNVVQSIVIAKYALELEDYEKAEKELENSLKSAKSIVDSLLEGGFNEIIRDEPVEDYE